MEEQKGGTDTRGTADPVPDFILCADARGNETCLRVGEIASWEVTTAGIMIVTFRSSPVQHTMRDKQQVQAMASALSRMLQPLRITAAPAAPPERRREWRDQDRDRFERPSQPSPQLAGQARAGQDAERERED